MANVLSRFPPNESTAMPQPAAAWSFQRRVFFRFLCAYFAFYSLPSSSGDSVLDFIPGASFLFQPYIALWRAICSWAGAHFFHLSGGSITYTPTGSGDTTLDYIQNLMILLLALAIAPIWSILDCKRRDYRTLEPWLRLLVRYTLAATLVNYGFIKIFPLQFQPPGLARLIEPYGDFSPMGALWWFMGASIPYIIFTGVAEALPGVLLLFRRTTTLGSLLAFAVMLNIMALNYCYDVPVKLYSTNLVLMSIYVASGDLRRLVDVFIRDLATVPVDRSVPRFAHRWARMAAIACQVLFIGTILVSALHGGWQGYKSTYVNPKRPPIYGLYEVEEFRRNGQEVAPLVTDATRWRKVIAEFPGNIVVKTMNDSKLGYPTEYDAIKNTITLSEANDRKKKYVLRYSRAGDGYLTLEGALGNDRLSMRLRKIDPSKFLLRSRGFHWINEVPLNR